VYIFNINSQNAKREPKNDLPGKIIANKVHDYAVNPHNNTVYYFTTHKGKDTYNEVAALYRINGETTKKIDEFEIGGGLVNAEPEMFMSTDAMALFIESVNLPGVDDRISGLCRQYTFDGLNVQKKDTYMYGFDPDPGECKNIFIQKNILITEGPYDNSYNSQIEKFFEFDGSVKSEQYKCPGIDTCDHKTILTIGQNTFTQYGSFRLSLNQHQVDSDGNLILSINASLYKIPTE
jgi:hypothetical protein